MKMFSTSEVPDPPTTSTFSSIVTVTTPEIAPKLTSSTFPSVVKVVSERSTVTAAVASVAVAVILKSLVPSVFVAVVIASISAAVPLTVSAAVVLSTERVVTPEPGNVIVKAAAGSATLRVSIPVTAASPVSDVSTVP
jgi:hypothetical protein